MKFIAGFVVGVPVGTLLMGKMITDLWKQEKFGEWARNLDVILSQRTGRPTQLDQPSISLEDLLGSHE